MHSDSNISSSLFYWILRKILLSYADLIEEHYVLFYLVIILYKSNQVRLRRKFCSILNPHLNISCEKLVLSNGDRAACSKKQIGRCLLGLNSCLTTELSLFKIYPRKNPNNLSLGDTELSLKNHLFLFFLWWFIDLCHLTIIKKRLLEFC